ncbi:MAG: dATP/dGTP pyrophosphohydrolase domain-containing protein [Chloroflexota bacterium]
MSDVQTLDDLQAELGAWGDATFGTGDRGSAVLAHFAEEVIELVGSEEPEEAADCAILLLQFAHRRGFSLREAIERKYEKNQRRQWGKPEPNGVVHHITEATNA